MSENLVNSSNVEQVDNITEIKNQDISTILKSRLGDLLESNKCFSSDDFIFECNSESETIPGIFDNFGKAVCLSKATVANESRRGSVRVGACGDMHGTVPASHLPTLSHTQTVPPITNRGASKYQTPIPPNNVQNDNLPEVIDEVEVKQFQRGGYDGGVEVGFEGRYLDGIAILFDKLENAKQKASEESSSCPLEICGRNVLVECSGANAGLHYKYVFTLDGVKFLLHHNPPKDRQAIRIRYGATSLIGRDFFRVHQDMLKFLNDIGFVVSRECLSRVDLQVLIEEPIDTFIGLIFSGHAISKSRKDHIYRNCGAVETYTLGNAGRIQLCIYDKRKEISHAITSDPVKFELVLRHCFGSDLYVSESPITRIEFRLWRDVLREIGINTVADLYLRENDLVKWLTYDWFRILSSPKIRGHENTAPVHPVWQNVIDKFDFWFSSVKKKNNGLFDPHPIVFNRNERISCNPELLEKQALGCLTKALAYRYGVQAKSDEFRSKLSLYLNNHVDFMRPIVNDKAKRIEIMKGVVLGENTQQDLTPSSNEYDCFVRQDRNVFF
ncbi:MAG: hypothetical protein LBP59_00015 [Planctomycetaceae bacterium]|nr:hypothetical protein [Planctomycetaceae bacterium]